MCLMQKWQRLEMRRGGSKQSSGGSDEESLEDKKWKRVKKGRIKGIQSNRQDSNISMTVQMTELHGNYERIPTSENFRTQYIRNPSKTPNLTLELHDQA